MNILFFISSPFTPNEGGVQKSTSKLAQVFSNNGHSCTILSLSNSGITSWENMPIVHLKGIVSDDDKMQFRKNLDKFKIDLVINQMGSELDITSFIVKNKINSVKVINTLRMNPMSFVQNAEFVIKEKLKAKNLSLLYSSFLKDTIIRYHRRKQKKILDYILNSVDFYVTLSQAFIPELRFFGIDVDIYQSKLVAIPNMFPPIQNYNSQKKNVVLFVGRLEIAQKRIDLLQIIWKDLHKLLPSWEFWVVGDGPERANFEGFCKRNALNRVKFFGFDEPNKYYAQAKILSFTSANEGFGNVLIEAQQYGVVPVMFNSYSAAPDLVKNGKTGDLVVPFDTDAFVQKTISLANQTEDWQKASQAAKLHAKRFEYLEISKKWENLLKSI
jgi:glycosyltransferase involved in cell wall biosynthesis